MKITVIGASAGVGLETVKRALERGHIVTTLSRTIVPIPSSKNLIKYQGSATSKADLLKSIENADAVIVALGTGNSTKATTLYSDFGKLLTEIQSEQHLQIPFIFLTGFGAGDSLRYYPFYMRIIFNIILKDVYADKTKMEEIIAASALNWVIVRPGILTNKSITERYQAEPELFKGIKTGFISRADVADYMVKQAENPAHLKKYVSLKG